MTRLPSGIRACTAIVGALLLLVFLAQGSPVRAQDRFADVSLVIAKKTHRPLTRDSFQTRSGELILDAVAREIRFEADGRALFSVSYDRMTTAHYETTKYPPRAFGQVNRKLNLGQLARERFGEACRLIGMTTHDGEVTAAHEWEEPAALRVVQPSLPGSYERLFHETRLGAFMLPLSASDEVARALDGPRLERAIGVLYRPETERASHYFSARLPRQFDTIVHVDRTRGLEPLERWGRHEVDLPETYPTGV